MTHSPKLDIVDIIYTLDSSLPELIAEVSYYVDYPKIDYPEVYTAVFRLELPFLSDLSLEDLTSSGGKHLPELITLLNKDSNFKGCVASYYQEVNS